MVPTTSRMQSLAWRCCRARSVVWLVLLLAALGRRCGSVFTLSCGSMATCAYDVTLLWCEGGQTPHSQPLQAGSCCRHHRQAD